MHDLLSIAFKPIILMTGIFLIAFVGACDDNPNLMSNLARSEDYTVAIVLEEIYSIGDDEQALFAFLGDITSISDGSIFIADRGAQQVVKLDSLGAVVNRAGKQGGGPGEYLTGPRFISSRDDTVAVMEGEIGARRIHYYDHDLTFIKTVSLDKKIKPTNGFALDRSGDIILTTNASAGRSKLVKVNHITENTQDYAILDSVGFSIWNSVHLATSITGHTIVAYVFFNKVDIFNTDGKQIATMSVPGLPARSESNNIDPAVMSSRGLSTNQLSSYPTKVMISGVSIDENRKLLFIKGGSHSSHELRDIYVYDFNGIMVSMFTIPELHGGHFFYIDPDGYLYIDEHHTILHKYKIHYRNMS